MSSSPIRTGRARGRNTRSAGSWILFAFCAPHAVLSWLLGLLALACWIAHRPRFEGAAIFSLRLRDWIGTRYRYSTTILRTIFWHPGREIPAVLADETDTPHEQHERVHVVQIEDAAVQGFFLGFGLAAVLWAFGWYAETWQPAVAWALVWLLAPIATSTNAASAVLRYGLAAGVRPDGTPRSWWARLADVGYLDSEHERSARAQTALGPDGLTWSEREDGARR